MLLQPTFQALAKEYKAVADKGESGGGSTVRHDSAASVSSVSTTSTAAGTPGANPIRRLSSGSRPAMQVPKTGVPARVSSCLPAC